MVLGKICFNTSVWSNSSYGLQLSHVHLFPSTDPPVISFLLAHHCVPSLQIEFLTLYGLLCVMNIPATTFSMQASSRTPCPSKLPCLAQPPEHQLVIPSFCISLMCMTKIARFMSYWILDMCKNI